MSYRFSSIFITKRLFASKPWNYHETLQWQQSFDLRKMPKNHLQLSFSRSSGPGGQNVNKVSTKVELRLLMSKADWIPDYAKERLKTSKHGEVIVTSDRTRSQAKNIEDCYDKLEKMIKESVAVARGPDQATLQRTQQL
ncbi:MAG: hypothetical protein EXX96DRAFT_595325 [Benjaminiella poitrasii]|nr:MAG: hypothetical protein EXX96DRAFT_595325 [Benjaminiella poitrasii]